MHLSIITVTYNSLHTLKDAYASLCTQTFTQWEWVVQDGGSSDGTQQWLEGLADPRISLVSEKDSGIYDALNKAVRRAKGEWIGLLHSDDLYPNNDVLQEVVAAMEGHDAIYGDLQYVQASDTQQVLRHWKAGTFEPALLRKGWMPPHPTLFLRKEIYAWVGGVRYPISNCGRLRFYTQGVSVSPFKNTLFAPGADAHASRRGEFESQQFGGEE